MPDIFTTVVSTRGRVTHSKVGSKGLPTPSADILAAALTSKLHQRKVSSKNKEIDKFGLLL